MGGMNGVNAVFLRFKFANRMVGNKKVVVIMPAYNAERTLEKTFRRVPRPLVDEVILTDDASSDQTAALARQLGIECVLEHTRNRGYGGNQKTCFDAALARGADIVVMLHPDYQYAPELIPAMVHLIDSGLYPVVFASRILGTGALKGGMPLYKYVFNRMLTACQNLLMGLKLSEYHTGYRAFRADVLRGIDYHRNSDDFVFDNQIILQIASGGHEIGEVSCPTRYFAEASSINFRRSMTYGWGVVFHAVGYRLHQWGLVKMRILK